MKTNINNKKGFTIIEVVLVLAIAGLIFLMVFIALPALNRGQRNTQRKQDMARVLSQITEYESNNGGKTPFVSVNGVASISQTMGDPPKDNNTVDKFIVKYLIAGNDDGFKDPDGSWYEFRNVKILDKTNLSSYKITSAETNHHNIYTAANAVCGDEEGLVVFKEGVRNIAIMYILEGGSIYCGDTSN